MFNLFCTGKYESHVMKQSSSLFLPRFDWNVLCLLAIQKIHVSVGFNVRLSDKSLIPTLWIMKPFITHNNEFRNVCVVVIPRLYVNSAGSWSRESFSLLFCRPENLRTSNKYQLCCDIYIAIMKNLTFDFHFDSQ